MSSSQAERYYLGQMSGTSVDGVDLTLIGVEENNIPANASVRTIGGYYQPYPPELTEAVLKLRQTEPALDSSAVKALQDQISKVYIQAIRSFAHQHGFDLGSLSAIGIHGQTVWHDPPVSIQLADCQALADELSQTVVGDFRQADLACGGQGAPIAPIIHHKLWHHLPGTSLVVNIGGISNVTVMVDGQLLAGYDIGPGNVYLDLWCRRHFACAYDDRGELASQGQVIPELLDSLLSDAWFAQPPPKSTDQSQFNATWLDTHLAPFASLKSVDVLASLTALTATLVSQSLERYREFEPRRLIVSGGGCANETLVRFIRERCPSLEVRTTTDYGYDSDLIEAMAIGWLSHLCLHQCPAGLFRLTGARQDSVLGRIYQPRS